MQLLAEISMLLILAAIARLIVTMSLLELGAINFGGNDNIIAYFRSKGLLASSKTCARYINTLSIFTWHDCTLLNNA